MFNKLIILCITCLTTTAMALPTGNEILKKTDSYRKSSTSLRVEIEIKNYKGEKLDSERRYQVYAKTNRRSLVLSQHIKEKGQKFLMVDGNFWIIMPKSKRPIRITPRQKMLGNAALGDISQLTFSEDYNSRIIEEDVLISNIPTVKLELTAKANGTTYNKIHLWVNKENFFPIKADFFLKSGKLAKNADFLSIDDKDGNPLVTGIVLRDRIQKTQKTVMTYLNGETKEIPDRYYNPSYLIRSNLEPF